MTDENKPGWDQAAWETVNPPPAEFSVRRFIGHLCWWVGLLVLVLSGGCTLVFIVSDMSADMAMLALFVGAFGYVPAFGLFMLGRWLKRG